MPNCKFCGEDTDNNDHRFMSINIIDSLKGNAGKSIVEIWECRKTNNLYEGKLSDKTGESAIKDYKLRLKLWLADFNLLVYRELNISINVPEELKERGNCYFELGNFKQALADYSEAINLNPTDGELYYLRAITYKRLNKEDLAERDFRNATTRGYKFPYPDYS